MSDPAGHEFIAPPLWDSAAFIERFRTTLIALAEQIDGLSWADRCDWRHPGVPG